MIARAASIVVPLLLATCPGRGDPPTTPAPSAAGEVIDPLAQHCPHPDATNVEDPVPVAEPEFVAAPPMPPSTPVTSGFPQHDPRREITLWGSIRAGEPALVPAGVEQNGAWTSEGGRLGAVVVGRDASKSGARSPTDEDDHAMWFPRDPGPDFADGLVRARVESSPGLDVEVLFRQATDGDPPKVLSGYGLSIEANEARLYRWDGGIALPMGQEAKLAKSSKRRSFELVIFLIGPQVVASVYDGETLEHLATLGAHDTTYARGRAGLRIGPAHDGQAAFTFLSVMDAAQVRGPEHRRAAPKTQRYGMMAPGDVTPFGNTRYAWVRSVELQRVPKALRKIEARVDDPAGERTLLFLDTVGYERLLRSEAEVLAVDSNAAWSAFDPAFRARAGRPPKKQGRGFVLDESYKDPALVEALLRAYHERHPKLTTLVEIGRTRQNRPIWALKISDASQDPDEAAVLLDGAHHGSELLSIEYVLDAIDVLLVGYGQDSRITRFVNGLEIWAVPIVNVDGNHMFVHESRFAGRKNGFDADADGWADPFEGVDLNRNYPFGWGSEGSSEIPMHKWFRGPTPGSEPETKAMMALAEREHFAGVLSFHTLATEIYSPYGVPGVKTPEPDVNRTVGKELVALAPEQPNGRHYTLGHSSYPVAGSDQDWHFHSHGSIAFVVEGSHHNPPADIRNAAVEATRPIWQGLLDRLLGGPAIVGHVRDASGQALEATVMIAEHKTFEGEAWTTRARDGRFDRPVAKPGTYTLVVSPVGRSPIERRVEVRSRRVEVDVVVPDA